MTIDADTLDTTRRDDVAAVLRTLWYGRRDRRALSRLALAARAVHAAHAEGRIYGGEGR